MTGVEATWLSFEDNVWTCQVEPNCGTEVQCDVDISRRGNAAICSFVEFRGKNAGSIVGNS